MLLVLARHGQTALNASGAVQGGGSNPPLTETGRRQSELLAARFRTSRVVAIFTSDMVRAVETASYIRQDHLDADYIEDSALREFNFGNVEGIENAADLLAPVQAQWNAGFFDVAYPGGESPTECRNRIIPALLRVLDKHVPSDTSFVGEEQTIVGVLHGRMMRILLSSMLNNGDLSKMCDYNHHNTSVYAVKVVRLGNGAGSLDNYKFALVLFNDTSHLQEQN